MSMSNPNPSAPETLTSTVAIAMRDHPGAVSQVVSLLVRRCFAFETILSTPATAGRRWVWLVVARDGRLAQLRRQLEKLEDVQRVEIDGGTGTY